MLQYVKIKDAVLEFGICVFVLLLMVDPVGLELNIRYVHHSKIDNLYIGHSIFSYLIHNISLFSIFCPKI